MSNPLDDLNNALDAHQIVYWLARCRSAPTAEALDAMKEAHANHRKEPAPMPQELQKHEFTCTPRQARRISENLEYVRAARELLQTATVLIHKWNFNDATDHDYIRLDRAAKEFRTIADE